MCLGWVLEEGSDEPREKKKKKDKLLLVPLFLNPSDVPFLLVVWKTLTPPLTPPPSSTFPILRNPDLLHSPLHRDKWLGPASAQMTQSSETSGEHYEEDHIWLSI